MACARSSPSLVEHVSRGVCKVLRAVSPLPRVSADGRLPAARINLRSPAALCPHVAILLESRLYLAGLCGSSTSSLNLEDGHSCTARAADRMHAAA